MAKNAADADLAAAAYWKRVAAADTSEITMAVTKIKDLRSEARRDETADSSKKIRRSKD